MSGTLSTRLKAIFGTAALGIALTQGACDLSRGHEPNNSAATVAPSATHAPVAANAAERVVRLYGPIDWEMADTVKAKLRDLDKADPGKPITLVITSKGGLIPAGLDIVDTMANLKSPVNTLCERWCTSMAAVITASGAHRSSQPHAILRFHDVQLDGDVQLRGLEEQHLLDVLSKHTGRAKEAWADVFHEGRFISPRQALELGALDEIQGTGPLAAPKPST
jgi:ATP-dependent Clp protease protease subunit